MSLNAELTQQLIDETVGCQLHCKKPSFTRENSSSEKTTAASQFGADGKAVGFRRVWLDRKHSVVKPILAIFNQAVTEWRTNTHFYPHDGTRLCHTSNVEYITHTIEGLKGQLITLCAAADLRLPEIKEERQAKLGSLYRSADFFASFSEVFRIWVSWPQLMPDERLMQLNPAVYEAAQAKVQADFQVALSTAQDALLKEFTDLVGNLSDTLNGRADGQKKRFTEASVGNLRKFLDRFNKLNVGGQPELEALVAQAHGIIEGVCVADIKKSTSVEGGIKDGLNLIRQALPAVIEYKPDRELVLDEEEDVLNEEEEIPPLDDSHLTPADIPKHLANEPPGIDDVPEDEPPWEDQPPMDEPELVPAGASTDDLGLDDLTF